MRKRLVGFILMFCCIILFKNYVHAINKDYYIKLENQKLSQRQNQIIVKYKDAISMDKVSKELSNSKVISKKDKLLNNTEILTIDNKHKSDVIKELRIDKRVEKVEENTVSKVNSIPNDTYFSDQWAIKNTFTQDAWSIIPTFKKQVVVAVIDSGIDTQHDDLKNRTSGDGYDFILDSSDVEDINGHGTGVSGVIAAQANNNIGIAGVCGTNDVKILPLKTVFYNGDCYVSDVIKAVNYAVQKNVDVINLSLGNTSFTEAENEAIQNAINHGIVVVASAGNDGDSSYTYPASYNNVISAGSVNYRNIKSSFSNYNNKVSFVAPGENIVTCYTDNSYTSYSGTSFSAPMISGACAILKGINPSYTSNDIKNILATTSIDLGTLGYDNNYGYGEINLYNAVQRALNLQVKPAITSNFSITSVNTSQISLKWNYIPGARCYNIYRSLSPTGTYIKVGTTNNLTFTDSYLNCYTKYWYKVSGVNSVGEGAKSNYVYALTKKGVIAPSKISAYGVSKDRINIYWSSVNNISTYNVYRATSSSGIYSKIATVKNTKLYNYSLTANRTYYYKIRCVTSNGEGYFSKVVYSTTKKI